MSSAPNSGGSGVVVVVVVTGGSIRWKSCGRIFNSTIPAIDKVISIYTLVFQLFNPTMESRNVLSIKFLLAIQIRFPYVENNRLSKVPKWYRGSSRSRLDWCGILRNGRSNLFQYHNLDIELNMYLRSNWPRNSFDRASSDHRIDDTQNSESEEISNQSMCYTTSLESCMCYL